MHLKLCGSAATAAVALPVSRQALSHAYTITQLCLDNIFHPPAVPQLGVGKHGGGVKGS